MRIDSTQNEVQDACKLLCKHANKTDLLATFDLLMENFEKYGIGPSITYLQYQIETKFVHLQWSQANQRELESLKAVQDVRWQAMDLLLEMVEELGLIITNKGKDHPESANSTINRFRGKIQKYQQKDGIHRGLSYLILRIEQIDDF